LKVRNSLLVFGLLVGFPVILLLLGLLQLQHQLFLLRLPLLVAIIQELDLLFEKCLLFVKLRVRLHHPPGNLFIQIFVVINLLIQLINRSLVIFLSLAALLLVIIFDTIFIFL